MHAKKLLCATFMEHKFANSVFKGKPCFFTLYYNAITCKLIKGSTRIT